jgi:rhamnose transport system substrate-binding protein
MHIMKAFNRRAVGGALAACLVVGIGAGAALTTSATAQPTAKAAAGKTIEFIEVSTGIPYYNPLIAGFKTEAAKLGLGFSVVGPAAATASSQIPFIQQAIVRHISGIAIQPNDPAAPLPALRQAKAAGLKIVETNVDSLPESLRVAGVTALNYNLVAASQLAEVGKLMNYTGQFAILSATTTSIFQNQVIAGFKKLLASDPKYKNMQLVKIAYGSDASAPSVTATNALITEFPHLKAITSPTTVGIAAAAQAIESAHKAGKIILTGLGEPIEMKKFILDGTVKEYQLWNVANMGVVSAYVLGESLSGVTFPPGKSFQVPGSGLGTLKVSSDGDIYCQPGLTTFNKANVNKYNF